MDRGKTCPGSCPIDLLQKKVPQINPPGGQHPPCLVNKGMTCTQTLLLPRGCRGELPPAPPARSREDTGLFCKHRHPKRSREVALGVKTALPGTAHAPMLAEPQPNTGLPSWLDAWLQTSAFTQ